MAEITTELNRIICVYRDELTKMGFSISAIFLYGSYAKGKQHEGSDIDLIVISPDFAKLNTRERLEILGVAAGRIMEPIEAFGITPDEISQGSVDAFLADILKCEAISV